MFVTPQGVFKVLRNIPFNSDRKHTRLFGNQSEQLQYFLSNAKYTYSNFTYIRHSNSVKVPTNAENLWDCNYVMFKNQSFGNKWFYGFITGVEYINNTTAEVFFEIDNFQTWWFDVTVGKCFVEREHVADDTIGLHTVSEPVTIGESIVDKKTDIYFGNDTNFFEDGEARWCAKIDVVPSLATSVIDIATKWQFGAFSTDVQGNQLVGESYKMDFTQTTPEQINAWMATQGAAGNKVTDITMFPAFFESLAHHYIRLQQKGCKPPTDFFSYFGERYVPKNNKLFTYPYTYLKVDNNQGTTIDYKWEDFISFEDNAIQFELLGYAGNSVACELRPISLSLGSKLHSIGINNFPKCSYSQNMSIEKTLGMLAKGLTSAVTSVSGSVTSTNQYRGKANVTENKEETNVDALLKGTLYPINKGVKGTLHVRGPITKDSTRQTLTEGTTSQTTETTHFNPYQIAYAPLDVLPNLGESASVHGASSGDGNFDVAHGTFGYCFYVMSIRAEYAKIVDDYFTRFGYNVKEYKVPELFSRSAFNFVKTVDCNVTGEAPNEALEEISKMFDAGLTLWHTSDVGNYTLSNNIIS